MSLYLQFKGLYKTVAGHHSDSKGKFEAWNSQSMGMKQVTTPP